MTEMVVTFDDAGQRPSLRRWLEGTDDLSDRLSFKPPSADPGELGTAVDMLSLVLQGGGTVTVVVQAVYLWARSRRSDVNVKVSRGKKSVVIESRSVRNASTEDLEKLARAAAQALDED